MDSASTQVLFLSTYIPGEGPPSRYAHLFSKLESEHDIRFDVQTGLQPRQFVTLPHDVVMGSDPATFARAWLLGRRFDIPIVYDFRDPYLIFYDRLIFAKPMLNLLKDRSDAVLTSMKYYIEEYDLPKEKCVYAPNVAPLEWTEKSGSPNHQQLCYAGQIIRHYNLDVAIKATARLTDDFPDISLKIAGQGPLRPELEALADDLGIAERVQFLGVIPHDELPDLFIESEAGLALNPWVGKKEFEYMACGRPCLSNEERAKAEGVPGLHTVPATTDGVMRGMRYLLENDEERRSLGAAGREGVREFYNLNRVAGTWRDTIVECQQVG